MTPNQIISASGSSALRVHSTTQPDFPLQQTIEKAHKLGCHHITASKNGAKLASAGFDGELKLWTVQGDGWNESGQVVGRSFFEMQYMEAFFESGLTCRSMVDENYAGEVWAIALSEDGHYLASTTYDGRINVWDTIAGQKIREYETKGSYGMTIDLVRHSCNSFKLD